MCGIIVRLHYRSATPAGVSSSAFCLLSFSEQVSGLPLGPQADLAGAALGLGILRLPQVHLHRPRLVADVLDLIHLVSGVDRAMGTRGSSTGSGHRQHQPNLYVIM